ncbi:unnamed protein product [Staurois parvus]|uniref:Uncharacterized protein n=1 Tax=Staurois parvus TaxID=386267 RepID=A0ABN9DKL9_9NEOB|nr:unnamed protein product [Staurois parvus]
MSCQFTPGLEPPPGFVWARTQGPHDPLLPRGPMSCQSAPGHIKVHHEYFHVFFGNAGSAGAN